MAPCEGTTTTTYEYDTYDGKSSSTLSRVKKTIPSICLMPCGCGTIKNIADWQNHPHDNRQPGQHAPGHPHYIKYTIITTVTKLIFDGQICII
jgi:hypothetical protein